MSDQGTDPIRSPRLLQGLLGVPAANRERLSHLVIRGGKSVSVQGHFYQDLVPPFAGDMAAEPGISEQIAELRTSGLVGAGIDVNRRDGLFHVKLWSGAHERAAWERRMTAVVAHPQALRVLAAAGELKAQQLRAQWAQQALQRATQDMGAALPGDVLRELAQTQPPTTASTAATQPQQLVRMPTGHSKLCPVCATPAFHTLGDVPLHPACMPLYLEGATAGAHADDQAVDAVNEVETPAPVPLPAVEIEPQTEEASLAEQDAEPERSQPAPRAEGPTVPEARPAIVLDADVVGLPDGSQEQHPFVVDGLDKVAALVSHYELGQRVTKGYVEPGQVWLTGRMLKALDLPSGEDRTPEEFRAATVSEPALVAAVQAGWEIGGGNTGEGPSLGRWTRMSKGALQVRLAVIPLMTDLDAQPVLQGDPSPGVLARRLALFAGGYGHPFKISPQSTGQDFLQTLRWKERASMTEPQPDVIHAKAELDGNWTRKPNDEEQEMLYLHGYDRGGSYLSGLSSNGHYGVGQPVHVDGPVTIESTTYGLVKIAQMPTVGDWRAPHPLLADVAAVPQEPFWRHTNTVRWAQELGYEVEIVEAWIWPRTAPIFRTWYPHLRNARQLLQELAAAGDPDAKLALAQLKAVYTRTIGGMGSKKSRGQAWYAPDRRWGILAQARVNIERMMHRIGTETADQRSGIGVWPLAWDNDTFVYASNDPDPESAWPGNAKDLGSGVGKVRWEGSTMLADHLEYLSGKEWSGKDQLTKDWDIGGKK